MKHLIETGYLLGFITVVVVFMLLLVVFFYKMFGAKSESIEARTGCFELVFMIVLLIVVSIIVVGILRFLGAHE